MGIDYERSAKVPELKQVRGRGGFIRSNWQELNQLLPPLTSGPSKPTARIALPVFADPGDVDGFLRRRNTLSFTLGGTCLSFYDWYCDLPPASP